MHACGPRRDELAAERLQSSELQTQLSSRVQEKLAVEADRDRLGLEAQHLRDQLHERGRLGLEAQHQRRQELLSSRQEKEPESHRAPTESSPSPAGKTVDEGQDQVPG